MDPIFFAELLSVFGQVGIDTLEHAAEIVGMDAASPLIDIVLDFMVIEPAHRFPTRGKEDVACLDVPIPDSVVAPAHGKVPPFFAGAERIFDPLPFGDVEGSASHAEGMSGRIPIDVAARMDEPDFAVRTDDAIFHIVDALSEERIVDGS